MFLEGVVASRVDGLAPRAINVRKGATGYLTPNKAVVHAAQILNSPVVILVGNCVVGLADADKVVAIPRGKLRPSSDMRSFPWLLRGRSLNQGQPPR